MTKQFSHTNTDVSLQDVHESIDTTQLPKGWKRILAYIGPAYLVSVGYMDPGNWATDLQGGSRFGYRLIWVLLMSNLMAILLQSLSARLGIVRRRDLAQANREVYPPVVNFFLYVLAELAIAATDLAEVLGMAIGLKLLTGLPIIWGVSLTVLDTFLLFYLQKLGMRKVEAFIISLVAIIAGSFFIELFLAKPQWNKVIHGFVPGALSGDELYIAIGIIGATIMPHNLYLHSALVQTRKIQTNKEGIKRALRFNFIDSAIALNAAFLVNASILILSATVFFVRNKEVAKIEEAHQLLQPLMGSALAPVLFAVALIAAGQSSTVTGTMAGQIVMEGYLRLRINPLLRRFLTRLVAIIPAFIVILISGDSEIDNLLVLSQVILSMQLSFAIIPLIHFVSDKATMGGFVISIWMQVLSWIVASILVFLNVKLITETVTSILEQSSAVVIKIIVIIVLILFIWLFLMMIILPIVRRNRAKASIQMHKEGIAHLGRFSLPAVHTIAIALDFTTRDEKLIAHAIREGGKEATYLLVHIVETVSAKYLGVAADDYETREDRERLENYASQLNSLGYKTQIALGFKNRVEEIIRIVHEVHADMLIMGAHRHGGLKDIVYGSTSNQVRHKLSIPVLIIN